jgi:aquaporin Z
MVSVTNAKEAGMTEDVRKLVAEALGTALLVFFGCGVATLSFGFNFAFAGTSLSAGVVATAFAFGLVLLVLAYSLGPISGCHINPAVTIGFLAAKRITVQQAVQYWIAQFVGGVVGAAVLWAVFAGAPAYDVDIQGLGANGFDELSMVFINTGGAFLAEVILTFLFVYVVLAVTGRMASAPTVAGVAIGIALVVVHLIGIPLTGTSVNPARSLGPAIFVGGEALEQVWLFILAPLVGGALAALAHEALAPAGHATT